MTTNTIESESVKKICESIEERDQKIIENNVKIKYIKDLTEKLTSDTKELERKKQKLQEEIKFHKEQNKYFQLIQESLEKGNKLMEKCIINHQTFEVILARDSKVNQLEEQRIKEEFNDMYSTIKKQLELNSLYQILEEQKVAYLKADIEQRQEAVRVKIMKKIISDRLKIKKQIFYKYFINLAKEYIAVQSKLKENTIIKTAEEGLEKVQSVKFKQEKILNINSVITIQQKEPVDLNQKISEMFQNEPEVELIPPKIRILSEHVIVPAFEPKNEMPDNKPKPKRANWLQKWKNRMGSRKSTKDTSRCQDSFLMSQQSEQSFSQQEVSQGNEKEQKSNIGDEGLMLSQNILGKIKQDKKYIKEEISSQNLTNHNTQKFQTSNHINQPTSGTMQTPSNRTPKTILSRTEAGAEENKCVRFNLHSAPKREQKYILQNPSFIDNTFSSFFRRSELEQSTVDDSLAIAKEESNSMLQISLMGNQLNHTDVDDFKNLRSPMPLSPEYEYNLDDGQNEQTSTFQPISMGQPFQTETGSRFFTF